MSCLLYLNDEENEKKVNIDDLYEKQKNRDLKQIAIFNKILNRVHKRIEFTGKHKKTDKHIFFTVPEYIFGEPIYNNGDCIGYLVTKLEDNGFYVRYIHPNTLFVSWHNWIPSYLRNDFKKKTGISINEKGDVINKDEVENNDTQDTKLLNDRVVSSKESKKYTPITSYKPTGNLVYNKEMFEKLESKFS
jgi:hypothetical protein